MHVISAIDGHGEKRARGSRTVATTNFFIADLINSMWLPVPDTHRTRQRKGVEGRGKGGGSGGG